MKNKDSNILLSMLQVMLPVNIINLNMLNIKLKIYTNERFLKYLYSFKMGELLADKYTWWMEYMANDGYDILINFSKIVKKKDEIPEEKG